MTTISAETSDLAQHSIVGDRVRADEEFKTVHPLGKGRYLSGHRATSETGCYAFRHCARGGNQEGTRAAGGV